MGSELKGRQAHWRRCANLAIVNPEHASYGRVAGEALQQLGLGKLVLPKLVLGAD